ncbi:MAG: aldehyde dehydrogenase [bacterium]|nr:MAG: aldehyde dehydrogenase [bacterium]
MENTSLQTLFERQQLFFASGKTRDLLFRKEALKKLRSAILMHEEELYEALHKDLHKSPFESYATEIGFVLDELRFHLKKLHKWVKPKRVRSSIVSFPARGYKTYEPLGTVLIIAPWNYPFQLMMAPLIGAISAGNTIIIKPSEIAENTALVIEKIINSSFEKEYIHVAAGGVDVSQTLLKFKFDHIFFTGSPRVGKIVMQSAAKQMVPVTLELGGKSPCIVDETAPLKLTARRIVWGKFLNAGQTCIAPDYLYVHEKVKEPLIKELKKAIKKAYGEDAGKSPDFPRIITRANMERLTILLDGAKITYGGHYNKEEKYFEPTILDEVNFDLPVMQQEIFGPILPVLTFKDTEKIIAYINAHPRPLALYVFSKNSRFRKKIIDSIPAGGVTVNDTLMHIASNRLPFGGVGNSGTGKYHGYFSFETFSNAKPVVYRGIWIDIPIRYAPYGKKLKIIKYLMH